MKASLALVLVTAVVLAGGLTSQPQQPTIDQRVQALEEEHQRAVAELASLRAELSAANKAIEQVRVDVDEAHRIVREQTLAGGDLGKSLTESEGLGFAWGENWKSREVLLKGLRAYLEAQRAALQPPKPAESAARR